MTTTQLGAGLVKNGKKVLIIDADAQGNTTKNLGFRDMGTFDVTLSDIFDRLMNEEEIEPERGILTHQEGMHILPSNANLTNYETILATAMDRERILKEYIEMMRNYYDFILFDCMPLLGVITRNILVSADSVLIPVEADVSSLDGIQELIKTIFRVKKRMNSALEIEGVLFVDYESRTNYSKDMADTLISAYSGNVKFFKEEIPHSVRIRECAAVGESIFQYAPKTKVAFAYESLTREVLENV